MSNQETYLKNVEAAIRAVLNTKEGEITPKSCLVKDLGAESIDFLDISCELEKLVGTELDFKEVMRATKQKNGGVETNDLTVQDVVDYLIGHAK